MPEAFHGQPTKHLPFVVAINSLLTSCVYAFIYILNFSSNHSYFICGWFIINVCLCTAACGLQCLCWTLFISRPSSRRGQGTQLLNILPWVHDAWRKEELKGHTSKQKQALHSGRQEQCFCRSAVLPLITANVCYDWNGDWCHKILPYSIMLKVNFFSGKAF